MRWLFRGKDNVAPFVSSWTTDCSDLSVWRCSYYIHSGLYSQSLHKSLFNWLYSVSKSSEHIEINSFYSCWTAGCNLDVSFVKCSLAITTSRHASGDALYRLMLEWYRVRNTAWFLKLWEKTANHIKLQCNTNHKITPAIKETLTFML